MVKRRPVVVVSPYQLNKQRLCTVVPFSTVEPESVEDHHHPLTDQRYPFIHPTKATWVKCDMLYRVSFDRLDRIKIFGQYRTPSLHKQDMQAIMKAISSTLQSF